MFIKTIAVGPFAPTELCVTGGATVALPLVHREVYGTSNEVEDGLKFARFVAYAMGVRIAIAKSVGEREPFRTDVSDVVTVARRLL
jgi:hypothetical protein